MQPTRWVMNAIVTGNTKIELWRETVILAEESSHTPLSVEMEHYLVNLLIRFTDQASFTELLGILSIISAQSDKKSALQYVAEAHLLAAASRARRGRTSAKLIPVSYFAGIGMWAYAKLACRWADKPLLRKFFGKLGEREGFYPMWRVLDTMWRTSRGPEEDLMHLADIAAEIGGESLRQFEKNGRPLVVLPTHPNIQ